MLRFAANLSMLFAEAPFLDRFALAARAGLAAVECQFPYAATLRRTLVDNLRLAARAFAAEGLRLRVEPINTADIPGCEYKPAGRTEAGLGWLPAGALQPRA